MSTTMKRPGFTIIELLVVMTVIALLLTIAAPRYLRHIDRAKEVALREDLHAMRDAIDKYYADRGSYPSALTDLVEQKYLREIPSDPVTDRTDSWIAVPPNSSSQGVFNVRN